MAIEEEPFVVADTPCRGASFGGCQHRLEIPEILEADDRKAVERAGLDRCGIRDMHLIVATDPQVGGEAFHKRGVVLGPVMEKLGAGDRGQPHKGMNLIDHALGCSPTAGRPS